MTAKSDCFEAKCKEMRDDSRLFHSTDCVFAQSYWKETLTHTGSPSRVCFCSCSELVKLTATFHWSHWVWTQRALLTGSLSNTFWSMTSINGNLCADDTNPKIFTTYWVSVSDLWGTDQWERFLCYCFIFSTSLSYEKLKFTNCIFPNN